MTKLNLLIIKDFNKFIDYLGLVLVGALSLGYTFYSSRFAKLHLNLPFLQVPFFIGDILFVICFFLFLLKWRLNNKKSVFFTCLFLIYLAFVFVKTFTGYIFHGPLSLRHSVLFLYPLFAVFCSDFFRMDFFESKRKAFLIAVLLALFFLCRFVNFYNYAAFTCLMLALALAVSCSTRRLKVVLCILVLLIFPYKVIFTTSRTFIVSNLLAVIYTSLSFLIISKFKSKLKLGICLFTVLFIFYGVKRNCSSNELKSLIGIEKLSREYDKGITAFLFAEKSFVEPVLNVKLYNEETAWKKKPAKKRKNKLHVKDITELKPVVSGKKTSVFAAVSSGPVFENKVMPESGVKNNSAAKMFHHPMEVNNSQPQPQLQPQPQEFRSQEQVKLQPKIGPGSEASKSINQNKKNKIVLTEEDRKSREDNAIRERGPDIPYHNSLFRIFIWKDAFSQLKAEKPLFGFAFGRPFRSHMIEVLHMAWGEWSRDGWICFHNSYIDIIYRAGVFGIFMIIFIFSALVLFIKKAYQDSSLIGVLLTGTAINWLVAANFLEILEMPYSAIPFWSLFGLTGAYLFRNKSR